MKKIGRNEPCPCGSGLKHKKCCLLKQDSLSTAQKVSGQDTFSVASEVAKLQKHATTRQSGFKLIGTLVFFATDQGDAWLLELTDNDALRVSRDGKDLPVVIDETDESLEINWTHSFAIKGGQFVTTAYLDNSIDTYSSYPVTVIKDAQNKFQRKFSKQELKRIHK